MEINISIGERLREEREGLGKTQGDVACMAAEAGVPGATRQSQARYEKGLASPSAAYLAVLAKAGADIRYILTGDRELPAPVVLTAEEQTMLGYFRDATKEVRRAALGALLGASSQQFEGSQQVFRKAPRGDVAGRDIVKGGGKR